MPTRRPISGKVIDIRTGRAIKSTASLTDEFIEVVRMLVEGDKPFYLVHGRCRHADVRDMVTGFKIALQDIHIIYDGRMPSDTVWAFDGTPEELGFAI